MYTKGLGYDGSGQSCSLMLVPGQHAQLHPAHPCHFSRHFRPNPVSCLSW